MLGHLEERMAMPDITYDAGARAGWALIKQPTSKEIRYCRKKRIEIIETDVSDFMEKTAIPVSSCTML